MRQWVTINSCHRSKENCWRYRSENMSYAGRNCPRSTGRSGGRKSSCGPLEFEPKGEFTRTSIHAESANAARVRESSSRRLCLRLRFRDSSALEAPRCTAVHSAGGLETSSTDGSEKDCASWGGAPSDSCS